MYSIQGLLTSAIFFMGPFVLYCRLKIHTEYQAQCTWSFSWVPKIHVCVKGSASVLGFKRPVDVTAEVNLGNPFHVRDEECFETKARHHYNFSGPKKWLILSQKYATFQAIQHPSWRARTY